jgi:hypothetical protein
VQEAAEQVQEAAEQVQHSGGSNVSPTATTEYSGSDHTAIPSDTSIFASDEGEAETWTGQMPIAQMPDPEMQGKKMNEDKKIDKDKDRKMKKLINWREVEKTFCIFQTEMSSSTT